MLGKESSILVGSVGRFVEAIRILLESVDTLVKEIVAVVYETDVLGARVVMLGKAVDGLGSLGGELSDERRKRVKKNAGVENDSAARVGGIGVLRNVMRKVVNVTRKVVKATREVVKTITVLVRRVQWPSNYPTRAGSNRRSTWWQTTAVRLSVSSGSRPERRVSPTHHGCRGWLRTGENLRLKPLNAMIQPA
jgi:hypothetical protein